MAKDISRTLIVGLGGTGQTVIRDIKKRMLRTYGEIPPLVRFLEFDTDGLSDDGTPFKYYYGGQTHEDFKYRIGNNEFLQIPSPGLAVIKRDPTCIQKLDMDQLAKVAARLQGHGAGGYRVMGRSHFLNFSQNIINILKNTLGGLRNANLGAQETSKGYNISSNGITVYVIASIAGGTGSSAFQDMSRMLQIAGVNVQYTTAANLDKIFGIFFLPKFFEGIPNTDNVCINAYTALSELDYAFDLGDSQRHPLGSIEIQDDEQDYTGFTQNNKRVIFDSIYLVDALTSKGNSHTLSEASNYVASFIASSIAADGTALISSYVNSNHKTNTVDGKYQLYSGLGYCELRFNRQDLVKYLLNKKLINFVEGFKYGEGNRTATQIAEAYVNSNGLNEGVKGRLPQEDTRTQLNELTDAIINLNDRRLTSPTMASVDTGKEAATNIVTSRNQYLTKIGTAIQEIIEEFATQKESIVQGLKNMLDEYKTGKGFGLFPDLARSLVTIFNDMKAGLEDEVDNYSRQFESIERSLVQVKNTIGENTSKGFLGFGSKEDAQETAIRSYINKVRYDNGRSGNPTLAWLKVETARKNEAIAIYKKLIETVEGYYKEEEVETVNGSQINISGSFQRVENLYKALMELLIKENNSYQPTSAAVNETILADSYFKRYFESHAAETMPLSDQDRYELDEYISKLFAELPTVNGEKLAEMREKLATHLPASGLIRRMKEERISIDELFIECFGTYGSINNTRDLDANPQLKMLEQVNMLFETLWSYLNFRGQGLQPCKNMVVGVYDTSNNIFSTANGYANVISGWDSYSYVSLGDPDRIAFMLMETAIPAFKLMNVDSWASEFNQKKQYTYTFSDKRLENIDMIMPGVNEEAEIAWAYGWLFGLITNSKKKRGLRVKPSYAYATDKNIALESDGEYNYFATLTNRSNIADCHRKFVNDIDISKDIYVQAMNMLGSDPLGNIIKIKEWVNDKKMWDVGVRGKERSTLSPSEVRVIQNEIKHLALRFVRLGYGLSLDSNGQVTHTYSEAIEEKEKAQRSKKAKDKKPETQED